MATLYYKLQVGDSILQPQQANTGSSQQNQDSNNFSEKEDSAVGYFTNHPGAIIRMESAKLGIKPAPEVVISAPVKKLILPPEWNFNSNFLTENGLTRTVSRPGFLKAGKQGYAISGKRPEKISPRERALPNLDWFLGIFLLVILLFIWIRKFYGKYFTQLANAVGSFQISAKLYREKNIMVRRVSFVLDFIYLVVLSVFTYEMATHFNWFTNTLSRFNQYMLLLNIIMLYSLLRVALLRITGILFLNYNLFSEYIHNSFVINKGTGIILFPLVITAHYFPFSLVGIVLITGLFLLIISVILKSIRAYQIIKRKDVVLFYLILYLCTLEFLPLLLGYKIIISLI